MTRQHSIQLLGFRDNVHVAHWQAARKTNEHETLGNLYEAITPLIDKLTELAISRDGATDFPADAVAITNRANYAELLSGGCELLDAIRATLTAGKDDDMLNVVADISAEIHSAAFLLEVTV